MWISEDQRNSKKNILKIYIVFAYIFITLSVNAENKGEVLLPISFGELYATNYPNVKGDVDLTVANTDKSYYFLALHIYGIDDYHDLPLDGSLIIVYFKEYSNASHPPIPFTIKLIEIGQDVTEIYAVNDDTFFEDLMIYFYSKGYYSPIEKIVYFSSKDIVELIFMDPEDKLVYYKEFKDLYNRNCDYWKIPIKDRKIF